MNSDKEKNIKQEGLSNSSSNTAGQQNQDVDKKQSDAKDSQTKQSAGANQFKNDKGEQQQNGKKDQDSSHNKMDVDGKRTPEEQFTKPKEYKVGDERYGEKSSRI
jgi:hypothetical protein